MSLLHSTTRGHTTVIFGLGSLLPYLRPYPPNYLKTGVRSGHCSTPNLPSYSVKTKVDTKSYISPSSHFVPLWSYGSPDVHCSQLMQRCASVCTLHPHFLEGLSSSNLPTGAPPHALRLPALLFLLQNLPLSNTPYNLLIVFIACYPLGC